MTVVTTTSGAVRGVRNAGISTFHAVPYAAAPVGAARFQPPSPPLPWPGVRDAIAPGPVAPQPPSRLERVMGPIRHAGPQHEDCLSVTVWTPGTDGNRPVLVWLHGGGFSSGAGSAEWYSGERLAAAGDIVVVSVNYRLGALGFLALEPGTGNQGLLDMVAALRWVQANIAAFGGEPTRVTVAGQSAGALSALAMMASPEVSGLFRRVILQSGPFGLPPDQPAAAQATAELFRATLDVPASALHDVPVAALLDAQLRVAAATAAPLSLAPPFQLVVDAVVPPDPAAAVGAGAGAGIDMLIGYNRDEAAAFIGGSEQIAQVSRDFVINAAAAWLGDAAEAAYARHEPAPPGEIAMALVDEHMFGACDRLAAARAATGERVYGYRFDWRPTGSPFGACHCLELPFVFGNPTAWHDAPMLAGQFPVALAEAVQAAWIAFVRTGDPHRPGTATWSPYAGADTIRHFDDLA